jgi:hypothetical protein
MSLTLQSPQCFAIGMFLFGFLGFLQGWRRSVVLMGFTLAAVLFLYIGSANGIAEVLFVRIPQTINVLTGGAIGPKSPPPPSPTEVLIAELATLALAIILGFIIGGRAFPSTKVGNVTFTAHTAERFLGIIPGLVTGYALIAYFSHIFAANQTLSVGVMTPSPSNLGNYIVVLVIIALIAIVVGLLTARLGK